MTSTVWIGPGTIIYILTSPPLSPGCTYGPITPTWVSLAWIGVDDSGYNGMSGPHRERSDPKCPIYHTSFFMVLENLWTAEGAHQ